VRALCSLPKTVIDSNAFKTAYEEKSGERVSASTAKYIEYFLVQFGLLRETHVKTKYEITELAEELCDALSRKDVERYGTLWARAVLQQELKIPLIRDFLSTVSEPRSRADILKKFKRNGNVLIALCKEANLVSEKDGLVYSHQSVAKNVEEFWSRLRQAYKNFSLTGVPGARRNFVEIRELYHALLPYLDWRIPDQFDGLLRELADNREYRSKIEFSGAPVSYVAEKGLRPFVYDGKRYYYLSIVD
jgi:hypothetical protein